MTPLRLTILGAPRTKKTSNRILRFGGRTKVVPSAQFLAWQRAAVPQLVARGPGAPLPDRPYNLAAVVYRDARRGDLLGYLNGIADVLELAGVVRNDVVFEAFDGSRLALDRARPRVEVTITPLATAGEE